MIMVIDRQGKENIHHAIFISRVPFFINSFPFTVCLSESLVELNAVAQ